MNLWLNIANKHNVFFAEKFFHFYHRFGKWVTTKISLKIGDAETYQISSIANKNRFCMLDGKYCLDQTTIYSKLKEPKIFFKLIASMNCFFEVFEKDKFDKNSLKQFEEYLEKYHWMIKTSLDNKKKDLAFENFFNDYMSTKEGFPEDKIYPLKTCMTEKMRVTTNNQGEKYIPFLEDMKTHSSANVYGYVPSLYINGNLVRGIDKGDIAASAVCDSFTEVPKSCSSLHVSLKNVAEEDLQTNHTGILLVVAGCFVAFLITLALYKKVMMGQVDKDMTEMVNYHLERYQAIQRDGGI